jgi:hypothetical protein
MGLERQEGIVQRFHKKFRTLHFVLAASILLTTVSVNVFAGEDEIKAANISFKVAGQVVVIYYDLNASADQFYKVTLTLKKRFDSTFTYTPVDISGDVGPSVIPGENRIVTWKLADEFPKGLPGEDCFFVIGVESGIEGRSGISPLIWIAGGAAVVGGVILAVVLKGSTNTPIVPPVNNFPNPPGRP